MALRAGVSAVAAAVLLRYRARTLPPSAGAADRRARRVSLPIGKETRGGEDGIMKLIVESDRDYLLVLATPLYNAKNPHCVQRYIKIAANKGTSHGTGNSQVV